MGYSLYNYGGRTLGMQSTSGQVIQHRWQNKAPAIVSRATSFPTVRASSLLHRADQDIQQLSFHQVNYPTLASC